MYGLGAKMVFKGIAKNDVDRRHSGSVETCSGVLGNLDEEAAANVGSINHDGNDTHTVDIYANRPAAPFRVYNVGDESIDEEAVNPLSIRPAIARINGIQYVDLISSHSNLFDVNQGFWKYICSSVDPPFNWIAFLHGVATSTSTSTSALPEHEYQNNSFNSDRHPTLNVQNIEAVCPVTSRDSNLGQGSTNSSYAPGHLTTRAQPATPAPFSSLVRYNHIIFHGVKKINKAYKCAWKIIYILIIICVPSFFLIILFLMGCLSAVRRMFDNMVIHSMSSACDNLNNKYGCIGVGFQLLESYGTPADLHRSRNQLSQDAFVPKCCKVWILRVYILPNAAAVTAPNNSAI